ncbi:DNA translocase FtsK [Flavobacteriaceae bacterium 14752]|uniref:DNA translocase FtsK n=1 Tax=Mesohalobacter salilacus TaxID=2491711 RepID=UPI000F638403|nr:hypothetical protein EIG84_12250 [Flavobacteriaceae bacterium 14752]
MGKTEYKLIWKEGSFFEKGHWRLVPAESDNGIFIFVIALLIIVVVGSIGLMLIPLWSCMIGFQMIREKRYIAGIFGIIGFIYFLIDLNNEWCSSLLFYGWTSSNGELNNGILELKTLNIFKFINFSATAVGLWYIIDSIIVNYRKEKNIKKQEILIEKEKEKELQIKKEKKFEKIKERTKLKPDISLDNRDEMFQNVALKIIQEKKVSTSNLLFEFQISFERLCIILDQLESLGVITLPEYKKKYQVIIKDKENLNLVFEYLNINY